MNKITITIDRKVYIAELYDTPTARTILMNSLPIESRITKWGDEIYFQIEATAVLEESAKQELEIGDLAYWPTMPAFCIFFGSTPMSTAGFPVAAAPVNVFGKLIDFNAGELQSALENDIIKVEKI